MKMRGLVLFLLLTLSVSFVQAQKSRHSRKDSLISTGSTDTIAIKSYATRYDPNKALLLAAILPGAGQIYNKKYWKLPLVYGGFIAIGLEINRVNDLYKLYKKELFYNLENGYTDDSDIRPGDQYSTGSYRHGVDKAQRQRDFMVIMMGGMYLLQIIDAHVDAHLKEFDLNPNLQVKIQPMMEQDALLGKQTGFSLVFKF